MSRSIEYIVDVEVSLDDAAELGKRIADYLCERQIVLSSPQRHPYLGAGAQFATGPNVNEAATVFNDVFPNGMTISVGRSVFDTGENGFELKCPACREHFDLNSDDWAAAVAMWPSQGRIGTLKCERCGEENVVSNWFEPKFGFGCLAFEFSEWFLRPEFVDSIEHRLGHEVTWVKAHY